MLSITDFQFFDRAAEVSVTWRQLPHWQQDGATYFITYRTTDSIPRKQQTVIQQKGEAWLRSKGIDTTKRDWREQLKESSINVRKAFHRYVGLMYEQQLDLLEGECLLARRDVSEIVSNSLLTFDSQRYTLGGFVVMPNHVHVVARILPGHNLLTQCYNWKHYQSTEINKLLGRTGPFFQVECFDHLIRDEEHFEKFRNYLFNNPTRANLGNGTFRYHLPDIVSGALMKS